MKSCQIVFDAIGTTWKIDLDSQSEESVQVLKEYIVGILASFDVLYSRFRGDSLVSTMAQKSGTYTLSQDGVSLLRMYKKLYEVTDGAFTPLIGSVLSDAGYDASYSFQDVTLKSPPKWEDVIEFDGNKLTLKTPALLDFGGLGKGYMIDKIASYLDQHEIKNYCIDAGGDIVYKTDSEKPLAVGLEHPEKKDQVIGVAQILNESICASAGNRRAWGKYHHIINPHTLMSPSETRATWVVADSAGIADALATCLFLVDPKALLPHFSFSYCVVKNDYSVASSKGFPVQFF